jgi:non-reducing end alpha-L-arabinofuranosidase
VRIYDQTSHHKDLTIAPGGGANPTGDQGANAAARPVTAGGHEVYGVYISAGNAQSGGLSTRHSGSLPTQGGYLPMTKQGAIVLGIGGDNSNGSEGSSRA